MSEVKNPSKMCFNIFGCFFFLAILVASFIYLSMRVYDIYLSKETVVKKTDVLIKEIVIKKTNVLIEKPVIKKTRALIEKIENINDLYQLMDKIDQSGIYTSKELKIINKIYKQRKKELQNK